MSISTTSASMPAAIHAAFHPTLPAPSTTTLGRPHARRPTHQHTAPAVVALEEVGAHLRRQPPGDLAHRRQQRQRAVVELHGLVGDRRRAGRDQRPGDVRVGGEVEVREQRQIRTQEAELLLLRLLDLDDHLLRPGVGGGRHDVGSGGPVVVVVDRRAHAGAGLDEHVDAVAFELTDTVGRQRHPVLRGLDLFRHADGPDGC